MDSTRARLASRKGTQPKGIGDLNPNVACFAHLVSRKGTQPKGIGDAAISANTLSANIESRKGTQPKGIGDLRSGCVSFSFFVLVPKGPPAEEHWSSRMGSLRMIVGPLTLSKRMNQRTCWHIAPGDDVGHQVRLIAKKKNPRSADCFFPPAPRPAPNQPARRRISPATERRGWHEPNHKL